jgi:hypothetical protein
MSLPVTGQDPWDADLNAYLSGHDDRISVVEANYNTLANQIATLQTNYTALAGRVTTLETNYDTLDARISALEAQQQIPSLIFNYSNSTATPPATGEIRSNGVLGQASTFLYLNNISAGGVNISAIMAKIDATYKVYVQDTTDAATRQWYDITALPVNNTTWWQIPVTWLSGVTSAANKARPLQVVFTNQV